MVGEFSELQGIMGREYALIAGEKPEIANAIYEHYLPIVAGGDLPQSDEGAIVGLADKMDTIAGFFGVGMPPTGTADPYALRVRRWALSISFLSREYPLSLNFLIDESLALLKDVLKKPAEGIKKDILEFFKGRLQNQLIAQGYAYDTVDAVLSANIDELVEVIEKVKALEEFRKHPDFEPVSIAFKRVDNILKDFKGGQFDVNLLVHDAEINLFSYFDNIKPRVEKGIAEKDFAAALNKLAALRPTWIISSTRHGHGQGRKSAFLTVSLCWRKFRLFSIKSPTSPNRHGRLIVKRQPSGDMRRIDINSNPCYYDFHTDY
jgi:glycyl-tRNA synthetase beta chain